MEEEKRKFPFISPKKKGSKENASAEELPSVGRNGSEHDWQESNLNYNSLPTMLLSSSGGTESPKVPGSPMDRRKTVNKSTIAKILGKGKSKSRGSLTIEDDSQLSTSSPNVWVENVAVFESGGEIVRTEKARSSSMLIVTDKRASKSFTKGLDSGAVISPFFNDSTLDKSKLGLQEKKVILNDLLEKRPTREELITRNVLMLADDLDALYWGPFALQKSSLILRADMPFDCIQSEPKIPLIVDESFDEQDDESLYRIENGINKSNVPLKLRIEGSEKDKRHYKEKFFGKDHTNYIARDKEGGPVIVSISKDHDKSSKGGNNQYPTIIRNKVHDLVGLMTCSSHSKAIKRVPLISPAKYKDIPFKIVKESEFINELINFEEQNIMKAYKFGVLYAANGQTKEDEMFGNERTSGEYENFLNFLGDRIELKGWSKYKGGLDVKNDYTGTHSVYTQFHTFEIMFHVSTLLPYYPADPQQLERKRHLGNDVVVLIFQDNDRTSFSPSWIKSEFNHVFIVVQFVPGQGKPAYRISTVVKKDVPPFGPLFPSNTIFYQSQSLREFLLTLMINGERAALYAPNFANKLARTREALLGDLVDRYSKGAKTM